MNSATPDEGFARETRALIDTHGAVLLALAKRAICQGLESGRADDVDLATLPDALARPGACFVTLKRDGELRGCIGSAEAWRALAQDVADNAFAAAFRDPRFTALTPGEAGPGLRLSLAVLSPKSPIACDDEAQLVAALRPGTDGLIIADGAKRALFLPAVWEQLSEPEAFLAHLKAKAGMTPEQWSPGFQAWRFISVDTQADWETIDT